MSRNIEPSQIWVVLPTFNEAENITRMLGAINAVADKLQILVVDDDSPDGTGKLVEDIAQSCSFVHVVHRRGERGLGTAYLAGFQLALAAGAEAIITMDCDFSHDPAVIPSLIDKLPMADLVIGSRYVPGGRIENWPLRRTLLSASANSFVRMLFDMPAHDCTSGFRLYRREILQSIPWDRVSSTGYSFLVETLYWATRHDGMKVTEVPICFANRVAGESKMGLREALYGMINLIRLKLNLRRKQPQADQIAP